MAETREIKTTLALDGEKEFKASLDEAYRGIKVLGSEMKLNTAIFGDNGSSMDGLTKKGEILRKEIAQQKDIVAALSKAVEESATAYGETDKKTDAYRIKLNNATTALNNMEGELGSNETAISNLGNAIEDTDKKTVSWKENLERVSKGLDDGIKALTPITAGIAAAGAAAIAAGKQIFDLTSDTGKYADELITTSNQTGISTKTLQEWEYAARFVDVEVETMTGSMAKMIRNMDSARKGTGDSNEAFKTLGISVTDSNGNLRDSNTVFMEAIDALGKVSNETERDALSMKIFGKSAQELNPLIKAGSDELTRLGEEAENAGLIMSDDAVSSFGAFDDSMQVMDATIDGVKRSFVEALLPAIQTIVPIVQNVATEFGEWLRSDGAQEALGTLTEKIAGVAEYLGQNMQPIIETVISAFETAATAIGWLIENFDTIITVGGIFAGVLGALQVAQMLVNIAMAANPIGLIVIAVAALIAGIVLLIQNWDSVKQVFLDAWEAIKQAWDACIGFFAGIWDGIKNAFASVGTWFSDVFTKARDGIQSAWSNVKGFFSGVWDGIKGAFSSADTWMSSKFGSAWDGIKKAFQPFIDYFKLLWDTVKGVFSVVGDVLTGNFSSAWEGIKKIFTNWGDFFKGLWTQVTSAFSGAWSAMVDVGKNIVSGIWDGIKNAGTWLYDKVTGWAGSVVGWFKDLFGIHSPSSVMRDMIGKPMAEGIAAGITGNAIAVEKAMAGLVPDGGVILDVTRRFNNVASSTVTRAAYSDTSSNGVDETVLDRLVTKIAQAIENQPAGSVFFERRELGRVVREVLA